MLLDNSDFHCFFTLLFYTYQSEGIGVCIPDAILNSATNTNGVTAEVHLCGAVHGYYYYIDLDPSPRYTRKVVLPESPGELGKDDPHLRWIGNNDLEIILPKGMSSHGFNNPEQYGGVKLTYVYED